MATEGKAKYGAAAMTRVEWEAVNAETIKKELRHSKLFTEFSINPYKKSKLPWILFAYCHCK